MTLCGQTKLHWPHWMQRSCSQTGTLVGDVALLVGGGARREGAVDRHEADRDLVAAAGHHPRGHLAHERRARRRAPAAARSTPARRVRRHRAPRAESRQRAVDRGEVLARPRRRPCRRRSSRSASLMWPIACSRGSTPEIAKKQVCRTVLVRFAEARPRARPCDGVDDEEAQLLVDDLLLHRARQLVPDLVGAVGAVEQERGPRRRQPQHVLPLQKARTGGRRRSWPSDQIGRVDRPRPEAQMRDRLRAGFVRVVDEIALRVEPGILGDDLDAVLVGADRAVGAKAVEHGADDVVALDREARDRPRGWYARRRR